MAPIEINLSWGVIYFVMALPAILMLSNFVFGSCTVAEFVDEMSGKGKLGEDDGNNDGGKGGEDAAVTKRRTEAAKRKRTLGKLITTSIFVLFSIEPFIYLRFVTRGKCDVAGAIFFNKALTFGEDGCGWGVLEYLSTWALVVGLFISCILSDASGGKHRLKKAKDADSSAIHRCRTCNNSVPGHDHHCIFVNNCIGVANYKRFFLFVIAAFVNTFYIFFTTCGELFERGSPAEIILGLVCYTLGFGVAGLLSFHVLLIRKGVTTAHLLRTKKGFWGRVAYLLS